MNALTALGNVPTKASKYRAAKDIMKTPHLKSKLTNLVDEAVECKIKIASLNQTIKGLRDTAVEELEMNPKQFNAYVAAAFNNDYMVRRSSHQEIIDLLDNIIGLSNTASDDDNDE